MKPIRMLAAILALLLLPAAALAEEYAVPEAKKGREAFLHDGNEKTYLTAYSPEGFTLSDLSAETRGVMLAWFTVPDRCEAQLLDETGKVVLTRTLTGGSLHQYLPTDGAAGVRLTGSKLELAEFCAVTDPDALPFTANDTPCDALLLLTHVGDESLAAAPALKVLTDHGLTVQIVYLYEEQRDRMGEAIETLRAFGISRDPVFLGWSAPAEDTKAAANRGYNPKEAKQTMQTLCDTYRPKIWITDGLGAGEVLENRFSEITPRVEKHYVLSEKGSIVLQLSEDEAALWNAAYRQQESQRLFRKTVATEARLQLLSKDRPEALLDGFSADAFLTYATPTPVPTETPTPAPTETPAPIEAAPSAKTQEKRSDPSGETGSEATPTPTEAPKKTTEAEETGPRWGAVTIIGAIVAAGAAIWMRWRARQRYTK